MADDNVKIVKYGDPAEMVSKASARGILETAVAIAAQAKQLAPVNKRIGFGGQLRNSIGYKTEKAEGGYNDSPGDRASQRIGSRPKTGEAFVGTSVEYAAEQEFGTKRFPAQPYLRPAGLAIGKDPATATKIVKAFQEEALKEFGKK